jgi:hypothetical protein
MKTIRNHIIQSKFGGSNHDLNLHTRDERLERAYHTVFPDMLPIDRVNRILELDESVYVRDAAQVLKDAIEEVRRE